MTIYSSLEYDTSYCMAQRPDLTLPTLTAPVLSAGGTLSAHDQKKYAIWGDHQQRRASPIDTKTTSTPATPIPVGQRAKMITCLCFVNILAMPGGIIAQQRCTGRSVVIRQQIDISKPLIFPFRVRISE